MLSHLMNLGIRAISVVTGTVPIDLNGAVPLQSSDISGALTAFFVIGPVLGILALVIGLRLAPQIMSALRSLGSRR